MFGFLFSPYGRISRKTYWLRWILPYIGISIVAAILDLAMFPVNPETGEPTSVFQAVIGLALLWPSLAVTTKRLHDRGMTGWWQVAPVLIVIPAVAAYWYYTNKMAAAGGTAPGAATDPVMSIVGVVVTIVVVAIVLYPTVNALFLRGQIGPNKYGDDPLGHPADTFA